MRTKKKIGGARKQIIFAFLHLLFLFLFLTRMQDNKKSPHCLLLYHMEGNFVSLFSGAVGDEAKIRLQLLHIFKSAE